MADAKEVHGWSRIVAELVGQGRIVSGAHTFNCRLKIKNAALGIAQAALGYDNLYALNDLVNNAIDAEARHIRITTKRALIANIIIQIADDGLGMNEAIPDYAASKRLIDSESALLIKPPPQPEAQPETRKPDDKESSRTAPGAVQFGVGHFEREGPIYAAEQRGRTIFIEWNADYPFCEKVILANRDNRDIINAVNAMIFSMAAAELRLFIDEDAQELFRSWKTDLSSNLRTLLS